MEPSAGSSGRPPVESGQESTPPETQIPDWVLRTGESSESRGPAAETRPSAFEEDAPLAAPPSPDSEMPDWLAGVTRSHVGEPPLPPVDEAAPEPEAPDWLRSAPPIGDEPVAPVMPRPTDAARFGRSF